VPDGEEEAPEEAPARLPAMSVCRRCEDLERRRWTVYREMVIHHVSIHEGTAQEVAHHLDVSLPTVHAWLRQVGLLKLHRANAKEKRRARASRRLQLVASLRAEGHTFAKIGRHMGLSRTRVCQLFHRAESEGLVQDQVPSPI
jgi:transposase